LSFLGLCAPDNDNDDDVDTLWQIAGTVEYGVKSDLAVAARAADSNQIE
jgi:hypothetical protein